MLDAILIQDAKKGILLFEFQESKAIIKKEIEFIIYKK